MTVIEITTLDEETFEKLLRSLRNANQILWERNKELREENRRLTRKIIDLENKILDFQLNFTDFSSTTQRPA